MAEPNPSRRRARKRATRATVLTARGSSISGSTRINGISGFSTLARPSTQAHTTAADERDPEFSADGRSVLFVSNRTEHFCIWALSLDGGVETQLTEESGDASFPTVSELGPVAYVLDRGVQSELRALLPSGVSTLLSSSNQRLSAPSWRPGGGVVVFSERDGSAGSRLQMLVLGEPQVRKFERTGGRLWCAPRLAILSRVPVRRRWAALARGIARAGASPGPPVRRPRRRDTTAADGPSEPRRARTAARAESRARFDGRRPAQRVYGAR